MSVRNVVLVTYSTTGNTKFIQNKIIEQLKDANFVVDSFEALPIIKSYQLGRKKAEKLSVEAVSGKLIPDLRQAIGNADVVGIGGFAFALQPGPGLTDIFAEEYLSAELFKKMKYFFSFGTAGQRIGAVHDILATLLSEKNKEAVYLGGLTVICPENFAPLEPYKPYRDMWSQQQLDKIPPFVDSLVSVFNSTPDSSSSLTPQPNSVPFKKAYFKYGLMHKGCAFFCGKVVVDKQKCVKCGLCVRTCPYGALAMGSDIEDGFPRWDATRCEYCHQCYNKCPQEAVNFSNAHTPNKTRHPSPFLDLKTGAILSTDAATHTVVGTPLPTPTQLMWRNMKDAANLLIPVVVILLLIIIWLVFF